MDKLPPPITILLQQDGQDLSVRLSSPAFRTTLANYSPSVLLDPNTYIFNNATMVLDNGSVETHTGKYSTDLIANRSVEFLGDAINSKKPFFLGITPIAPHSETLLTPSGPIFKAPVPADRHKDLFPDAKVPRTPNFNPDVVSDLARTLDCRTHACSAILIIPHVTAWVCQLLCDSAEAY